MSMPVYRCNELSYVYTHKFSMHLKPLNGKCRTAILNVLLQLTAIQVQYTVAPEAVW